MLVVGAGLSGLAAAWALVERGRAVEVVDAADHVGGLISTRLTDDGLVETAANALVSTPDVHALATFAGVDLLQPLASSRARYIFRGGRARRWPLGAAETIATAASFAAALASGRMRPRPGESVTTWADRVLGRAARTWLIAPALQGVYAASSDDLDATLIFGKPRVRASSVAPAGGMGALMTALHAQLMAHGVVFLLGRRVEALEPNRPTMVCTGARAATALIGPYAPALAAAVAAVRHTGLVTVTAFFDPSPQDVHGFGVLFPRGVGVTALGVLFNADTFAGRHGRIAARSETWIFADADVAALSDAALGECIARDREVLTGRAAPTRGMHVTRWPQAIPVYDAAVGRARDALATAPPWLRVTGNYLGELGVAALIARARAAASL